MDADVLTLLIAAAAIAAAAAALGWLGRGYLDDRSLRRVQDFFGLPDNSACVLVTSRDTGAEGAIPRNEVFALLELAAVIKNCRAKAEVVSGESARQGFGERTEFCLGGPVANRRMGAHLSSLLPGVTVSSDTESGPDRGAFVIGGERYRLEPGTVEHVLLARLTAGQEGRPVFLICGQRSVTSQAAARHLARHHSRLARRHGSRGTFCLLLRVVNSQAYGPDVVEFIKDVTRVATTPPKITPGKET